MAAVGFGVVGGGAEGVGAGDEHDGIAEVPSGLHCRMPEAEAAVRGTDCCWYRAGGSPDPRVLAAGATARRSRARRDCWNWERRSGRVAAMRPTARRLLHWLSLKNSPSSCNVQQCRRRRRPRAVAAAAVDAPMTSMLPNPGPLPCQDPDPDSVPLLPILPSSFSSSVLLTFTAVGGVGAFFCFNLGMLLRVPWPCRQVHWNARLLTSITARSFASSVPCHNDLASIKTRNIGIIAHIDAVCLGISL